MHETAVAFAASLLLGMRHATDADHVVAVTTIVNSERRAWQSSRIGVMWGLGHTLTILIIGGAIILFKLAFTPRVGLSMEFAVALMLIVLGLLNLRGDAAAPADVPYLRPFLVGTVHGMAGSAAAALLILSLIDNPRWAVIQLGVFSVGTIVGMTMVTMAIAAPAMYAGARMATLNSRIRVLSGAFSLAFGAYLSYRIGFVDGLFTSLPAWRPD
jgi:high-affinity nickel-transport protein